MSSHRIQFKGGQPLDELDELIRWALLDEVSGEDPSPQVWQNIQARLTVRSQAMPDEPGMRRRWRQFTSTLQAWALGIASPLEVSWDSRLSPRERSYLIWRESLLLSMTTRVSATIC
jgi:hypothetical protein